MKAPGHLRVLGTDRYRKKPSMNGMTASEATATGRYIRYKPEIIVDTRNQTRPTPFAMETFLDCVASGEGNTTTGRYRGGPQLETWPRSRSTLPQPPFIMTNPHSESTGMQGTPKKTPGAPRTRRKFSISATILAELLNAF